MNKIISKKALAENIKALLVEAREIAAKVLPGQFVVVIVDDKGERIPLTVVDSDKEKNTIELIFQEIGKSTCQLGELPTGANISCILGPLGKPTEIKRLGTVISIGGGVGIAEVYPVTRAFKQAQNRVISIIGARNKELLILEQRMQRVSDELFITTDDGSYGRRGFVSDILQEFLSAAPADLIYAVGPLPMMQTVAEISRPYQIKTMVSLNPIMVDATGMCGSCRVSINRQTKFGCVDGPEFDAHQVDFAELQNRLNLFTEQEKIALGR